MSLNRCKSWRNERFYSKSYQGQWRSEPLKGYLIVWTLFLFIAVVNLYSSLAFMLSPRVWQQSPPVHSMGFTSHFKENLFPLAHWQSLPNPTLDYPALKTIHLFLLFIIIIIYTFVYHGILMKGISQSVASWAWLLSLWDSSVQQHALVLHALCGSVTRHCMDILHAKPCLGG